MPSLFRDLPWQSATEAAASVRRFTARVQETGRLMVGMPDYDRYVAHLTSTHPDRPVMSYQEFFDERQRARYGGGRFGRCC